MNLLIKPASGACNMRCRYCFYADEMAHREQAIIGMMSKETLDIVVSRALDASEGFCSFMFQGGEPTLAGLDFYRYLIDSVKRYNTRSLAVSYAIQTNGYAVDGDWAEFFARNRFLVGLSIDGTRDIHDSNRRGADGRGSFDHALAAAAQFEKHHVDFNILSVVTGQTARSAVSIYNYFKKQGWSFQQYIPCLDGFGTNAPGALSAEQYGKFLCRMFDAWYADICAGQYIYNRTFENWMAIMLGHAPESCGMAGFCSKQYVIEADGGVYPCDFYVLDEYRLGSLLTESFDEIDKKRDDLGFIEASRVTPPECESCRWRQLCRGGCRRERETSDPLTPLGKNRFCESYRAFFPYAADRLAHAAQLLSRRSVMPRN